MKVAAQEIENSQVVLDIEVEDERLERAVDQAYRRIVQRINVPGFRKGKAPRALVERMVGREALVEDAVEQLVPQVVEDAVKQQELKMVARPSLEVVSTQPLQVKATVPVQPKVELGDYKSLSIEATPAEVTDEQVDRVVSRLQESNATFEPAERAVELTDRISIDILARAGETTIMESKDAEYVVDPEGPQPAEGFAEALVGQQPEETKTYTLKLPEDHRNTELAGQDAEFTITVNWVKAKILPPLDDDFASVVGTEFESMDALRGAIRENLSAREEHERRMAHEEQVVNAVVEQASVDLPPQLVEEEAGRQVQQLAQNMERQGIPLSTYLRFTQKTEEQFRAEMMAQAERSVRRSEVLNAVALAEGIDVTDDEIREQLTLSLDDSNESRRLIRDSMRNPMVRERMAASMRRDRAVRFLLETVGGVDFAALEAEAAAEAQALEEAADDVVLADPVDDAVDAVEIDELVEETVEELKAELAEAEAVEGAGSDAEGKPRDASGDTSA
ncbi:MAG: trigger factor [Chloroflexi bacterium]|nr:trigger factor [Chloroflexota bacterium]